MANTAHLALLKGPDPVDSWNKWRRQSPDDIPDLANADLRKVTLTRIDLQGALLRGANLYAASMTEADFRYADLSQSNMGSAELPGANFAQANVSSADLSRADLRFANFYGANLSKTKLASADLQSANLVGADLQGADLQYSFVYGVSAWDTNLEGSTQSDLFITSPRWPTITVDRLDVAQFIHLLISNRSIRDVIDTITSKVILILGRFTAERKIVLDALRAQLRRRNYSPIVFDFSKPSSRDLTETLVTLAHLARFIIADITDAKSIPQELQAVVPNLPSVPVVPILLEAQDEYGMFEHFNRYPWVLPTLLYRSPEELLDGLLDKVIIPAEEAVHR